MQGRVRNPKRSRMRCVCECVFLLDIDWKEGKRRHTTVRALRTEFQKADLTMVSVAEVEGGGGRGSGGKAMMPKNSACTGRAGRRSAGSGLQSITGINLIAFPSFKTRRFSFLALCPCLTAHASSSLFTIAIATFNPPLIGVLAVFSICLRQRNISSFFVPLPSSAQNVCKRPLLHKV